VGHSRVSLKSLLVSLDLNEACMREVESSRECLKVFAMSNEWPTVIERRWGAFYSSLRESSRWGVRNSDMSGSEAGHVRPTSLETGLGTGYIRPET
jgi:hypothetical protein